MEDTQTSAREAGRQLEVSLMPNLAGALQASFAGGLLYAAIVAMAALAAVFAPTPVRRKAAREVLKILLFRGKRNV
jgi:hypothetical protein